jgi:hypothetical protein
MLYDELGPVKQELPLPIGKKPREATHEGPSVAVAQIISARMQTTLVISHLMKVATKWFWRWCITLGITGFLRFSPFLRDPKM